MAYTFSIFLCRKGELMKESKFQHNLIKDLEKIFPGCIIMKNDSSYIQGIPDLTILYKDKWATLECKKSEDSSFRPNQEYYISKMNDMSYSAAIYPENREEILHELQQAFEPCR